MKLDVDYVQQRLSKLHSNANEPPVLVDLGVVPGEPFCRGEVGVANNRVDLSREMLNESSRKSGGVDEKSGLIRANIAQLEGFHESIADAVICLYSSFGMIRGREHRRKMLAHVCRMLKPAAALSSMFTTEEIGSPFRMG